MMRIAKHPHEVGLYVGAYMEEGDLDGIVSLFHPECVICFPPEEAPKHGHQAVREIFGSLIAGRPKVHNTVTGVQECGDIALLQHDWRFEDTEGNLLGEGKSTEVVRRLPNGGWGFFIDCPLGPPPVS
ncbi:nuclear transport factor 2 family protein [Roseibium denhamense]|uniref:SnoaL-like domain-containing protein n=1 Tax=Roseibium denhamense TaxID=76305 RepID=A0ABY1NSY0_9HYPH|nr:nuclear transport factor 2 family protein [Roseibium denhamense]MTI05366.1 nuclear transport factor 2 family protein [Roseibium denhamense]SMP17371.1 SnoaL-like domain-containing protein [Roseibium denhamense]